MEYIWFVRNNTEGFLTKKTISTSFFCFDRASWEHFTFGLCHFCNSLSLKGSQSLMLRLRVASKGLSHEVIMF